MAESALVCRECKRPVNELHTAKCPLDKSHRRQGQRSFVKEHQCHILTSAEGLEIARQLTNIKTRLGQLGLFRTMHKLDEATREIGYEMAEQPAFQR